jgi:hypothetical protein
VRLVIFTVLLGLAGCATNGGNSSDNGVNFQASGPGGLIESNLPTALRCGGNEVMVCESDTAGHACGCVGTNMLERNLGMMGPDIRQGMRD